MEDPDYLTGLWKWKWIYQRRPDYKMYEYVCEDNREYADPITGEARLRIDTETWQAALDGKPLTLTPVEFRLLEALAGRPGRVLSREQLLGRIYDDHRVVSDRTVDSHIKNLRRKLQEAAPDEDLVRSVYGIGYRLEA